jgi:hypothetical protein
MYKIIGGDGREYGPVSPEQLRQWITEGRANAQTLTQAEGGTGWIPLASFPELASALGGAIPPVAATPPVAAGPAVQPRPFVPTHLVPAILCTVFCCLPFGIPAIIFAAQVNAKLAAGDIQGALESSRKAKTWCWVAFWLGLIPILIWITIVCIGGLAGRAFSHYRI